MAAMKQCGATAKENAFACAALFDTSSSGEEVERDLLAP
jgi:hypothetical protein